MDPYRIERLTSGIREELEEMINFEMADPRVGPANVSDVHISPDHRRALVLLVLQGTAAQQAATLEALNQAKAFLKQQLTERLQLFKTPDLRFEAALPASVAARATQILKRIKRGRPRE